MLQNLWFRVGGREGAAGCWWGSIPLKVPSEAAAVGGAPHPCALSGAAGKGVASAGGALQRGGRARGGARVGSKSRCPLSLRCRGHQHIPAHHGGRRLLCGNRALRIAAAHAPVAARCLPRPRRPRGLWAAPSCRPTLHRCGRCGAPFAQGRCAGGMG